MTRHITEVLVDAAGIHLAEVRRIVSRLPDGQTKRDLESAVVRVAKAVEELRPPFGAVQ